MARGSNPGERRGGRQRGTPNKKTLLQEAAICAATTNPNATPLDFFLVLMRDPKLSTDLRVEMAAAAAAFVHPKRKAANGSQNMNGAAVGGLTNPSSQTLEAKLNGPAPQGAGNGDRTMNGAAAGGFTDPGSENTQANLDGGGAHDARNGDLSPLDFLLSVMNDPDIRPQLRIKVARLAAPYVHGKAKVANQPFFDDPFGFVIDRGEARLLRDDVVSFMARFPLPARDRERDCPEERALRIRIAKQSKAIQCPVGYTAVHASEDHRRVFKLFQKRRRLWRSSHGKLTREEDAEEAHLVARAGAYQERPEACVERRIRHLYSLTDLFDRTAEEQSEFDGLKARYPHLVPTVEPTALLRNTLKRPFFMPEYLWNGFDLDP